jgi:5-hydroxyisourate hydrolase
MTNPGTSLSTHVLDTGAGTPAEGVLIVLYRGDMFVTEQRTDADGRARLGDRLDPGPYRLVFHPPSPFFKRVELEVELEEGHYHVPLLVSPYSCASYRGS